MSVFRSFKRGVKFVIPNPMWRKVSRTKHKLQRLLSPTADLNMLDIIIDRHKPAAAFPITKDVIAQYITNPDKRNTVYFPRVCRTICSSDADYIPKVENAGQIIKYKGQHVQVMHNGVMVHQNSYGEDPKRVDISLFGTWTSDIISILKGHHEPQEEKAFYEILKDIPKGGVMLELGCWWAYYSMWFNKQIPEAKNYMIEPNQVNLEFGKANFALNEMQGDFTVGFLG